MSSSEQDTVPESQPSLFTSNTFICSPSSLKQTKIKTIKRTETSLPESKSTPMMPHLAFTCDVTCIQHLSYTLADQYELIELDKLDVILNTRLLEIRCIFMLNGLDHLLDSPAWIQQPLNEVMSKCGLSLFNTDSPHIFYYEMKTAFITTPLSYVLDQQAPHGILERFDIIFDYSTNKPKEFQAVWNRKIQTDFMIKYVYDGLNTILVKKTCCAYPFIFSHAYVKKLSNIMSFLPLIAQSLQKSYLTSKATMSVDNHAFSQGFLEKLKTIQTNTAIMNPSTDQDIQEDNISTYLTLGMYHAIKMAHKQKPSCTQKTFHEPPNAICTIAKLWSTTASKK